MKLTLDEKEHLVKLLYDIRQAIWLYDKSDCAIYATQHKIGSRLEGWVHKLNKQIIVDIELLRKQEAMK